MVPRCTLCPKDRKNISASSRVICLIAENRTKTSCIDVPKMEAIPLTLCHQPPQLPRLSSASLAKAPDLSCDGALRGNNYLPWFVAAVCLLLSFFTWITNRPTDKVRLDIAQLRAELIAANQGLVEAEWPPGPTPSEGATGDVVWSAPQQQGFMRFRGLPVNMPSKEQLSVVDFRQESK